MVDYSSALPQQQFFQPPDMLQNAMRVQQIQAQGAQMRELARQRSEEEALRGITVDPNSPEYIQQLQRIKPSLVFPALTAQRQNIAADRQAAVSTAELALKNRDLIAKHGDEFAKNLRMVDAYPEDQRPAAYNRLISSLPPDLQTVFPRQYSPDAVRRGMSTTTQLLDAAKPKYEMFDGVPVAVDTATGTFTPLREKGVAAPMGGAGAPVAGAAAPVGRAGAAAAPAGFDMDRAKQAIASIESGGEYGARGPVTNRGDRAFGKYQVMGANIPSWTKEALGRSMTPAEFLASPEAQERVFETQFGKSVAKYGNPADAASVWFSGRPLAKAGNASDVLGTTVPQYAQKFMAAYEGGANTPSMMRSPGFASSSGIPANVGLPVAPVLNALAGQQPPQQGNALAMQAAPMTQLQAAPIAAPQPAPALSAFQQAQQDAAQRKLQQRGAEKRQDLEIVQQERIQANLPQIEDAASQTLKNIEGLIGGAQVDAKGRVVYAKDAKPAHPGFGDAVGLSFSKITGGPIPGSSRSDFEKRLDQVKGSTFLDAYNMLRGGGAIDQKEGQKATAALNRMDLAQSEVEFVRAARDFEEIVKKGVARARVMAQGGAGSSMTSAATAATAPQAKPAERQVKRSGMYNGRRVVEYSDGATEYAD
jgi:hypothetical protein